MLVFPSAPPDLPGVDHTDVWVRRIRWHVATAGEGPPLVLLHGWPQHWWTWREAIGELAKHHRVYAPDLRGFGWSDAPEGRYGKAGLAADVELLLDELGIERCVLAGHDWGGLVAFLTALRSPERIERLAAFSIAHPWLELPRVPSPMTVVNTSYQFLLAAPYAGERVQRRVPALLRTLLRRGSAPGFEWDPGALELYVEAFRRPAHARAASALYRTWLMRELRALGAGAYANRRLEMPALLATGRHDPVVTPQRIEGAGDRAPQLRTAVVEGAGHFLPEERPLDVARLILEG